MSGAVYLTTAELADRWRTSLAAIEKMRQRGAGPKYVKLAYSGRVLYDLAEVVDYECGNKVTPMKEVSFRG